MKERYWYFEDEDEGAACVGAKTREEAHRIALRYFNSIDWDSFAEISLPEVDAMGLDVILRRGERMEVWVVVWDDLSAVFSTKQKALDYIKREFERIHAENLEYSMEAENWFAFSGIYFTGEPFEGYCQRYVVDDET